MKIAILGGSFNPIHIGHLTIADAVRIKFGYDQILFIPTNISPFKTDAAIVSAQHRLEMLRCAIIHNPFFSIETCELDREGISYTIDTLIYIEKKYADCLSDKIGLIIGKDLADDFHTWKNAELIAKKTDIILVQRPRLNTLRFDEKKTLKQGAFLYPHKPIHNIEIPISSSIIREAIKKKKSYRYLVPEDVYKYIETHTLYG